MRASTTAETVACQQLRPSANTSALMALPLTWRRLPRRTSLSEQCQVRLPAEPCCCLKVNASVTKVLIALWIGDFCRDVHCKLYGLLDRICSSIRAGEWCVTEGNYQNLGALNRTQFDDLATVNANKQHCNRLTSATCYRSRESMGKVFTQLQANATKAAAQTTVQVRGCNSQQTFVQFSLVRAACIKYPWACTC